jgi:hypothetical protein
MISPFSGILYTTAGAAGADPKTALIPAGRVFRIAAVNSFSAGRAVVAEKGKSAIAAKQFVIIARFGDDMDGAADQTDTGHFWFVADTVAVFLVVVEQLFGRLSVNRFHDVSPCGINYSCNFAAGIFVQSVNSVGYRNMETGGVIT